MVSIRDIAEYSGLSIGTISRYINKSGYVSDKSGKIIENAIRELDYVPNEHARAIFRNESKLIGVIVSSLSNPFFSELTMYFEKKAQEYGYGIILFTTDDNPVKERDAIISLKGYRVSGIITTRTQIADELESLKIPVISFEGGDNSNLISVSADNYTGGQMAFNHLYEIGCKNMLLIKGPNKFHATEMRAKGFLNSAIGKDVNVETFDFTSDFNLNYNFEKIIKNFEIKGYDGIFAFNDIAATILLSHLQGLGIRVPEDIKLIGFDNSFISELVTPKLTTINQSALEISNKCIELLMNIIKGKDVELCEHLLPVKLIKRKST